VSVGTDLSSPVELPAFETGASFANHGFIGLATYWVRAPGSAWNQIRIDPQNGGERTIDLWSSMLYVERTDPRRGMSWFARKSDTTDPPRRLRRAYGCSLTPLEPGAWDIQILRVSDLDVPFGDAIESRRVTLTRASSWSSPRSKSSGWRMRWTMLALPNHRRRVARSRERCASRRSGTCGSRFSSWSIVKGRRELRRFELRDGELTRDDRQPASFVSK
jgi:hypothetical protein